MGNKFTAKNTPSVAALPKNKRSPGDCAHQQQYEKLIFLQQPALACFLYQRQGTAESISYSLNILSGRQDKIRRFSQRMIMG